VSLWIGSRKSELSLVNPKSLKKTCSDLLLICGGGKKATEGPESGEAEEKLNYQNYRDFILFTRRTFSLVDLGEMKRGGIEWRRAIRAIEKKSSYAKKKRRFYGGRSSEAQVV